MALQGIFDGFTTCNNNAGSFTLTKLWIEKAEDLNLSATAVSVMTALLWHYNPAKKYVFPHQDTIAKRVKRSIATVKRAIAELKQAGFIISTRTRNGNLYAFTQVLFDTLQSQSCTEPPAQNEPSMYKEHVREQKTNNKAVVVSLKDFSKGVEEETPKEASSTATPVSSETHFDLNVIPDILKKKAEKGEIHNLQGYWISLRPKVKIEYWEKDTAEKLEIEKKEELKRKAEEEKARRIAEEKARREELAKPLNEQWTKQGAIHLIWGMRNLIKQRHTFRTGIAGQLAEVFNLDIDEIINYTKEPEVEK